MIKFDKGDLTMQDVLDRVLQKCRQQDGNIISVLQDIQEEYGYIPEESVNYLSEKMRIPSASIFGIATFYAQFHLKPRGKNIITTCCGTACHVKGSERLLDYTRRECGIPEHDDTSGDKVFTVEHVACVGACSMAPVVIVNKQVHGRMTAPKLMKEIQKLKREHHE